MGSNSEGKCDLAAEVLWTVRGGKRVPRVVMGDGWTESPAVPKSEEQLFSEEEEEEEGRMSPDFVPSSLSWWLNHTVRRTVLFSLFRFRAG